MFRGGKAGKGKGNRRSGMERRKQGPMLQKIEQQGPHRARGLDSLRIIEVVQPRKLNW